MTLREEIIYMLELNRGNFVSGQEMAQKCKVSRSAVAKTVALLKQDGFLIESVNRQGHRLLPQCDKISEFGIRAHLTDKDIQIQVFESIDSTNSQAKRAVSQGFESDGIFISDRQTAGRGRCGKDFYSPQGTGLYFSAVLHPSIAVTDATPITAAAAVAVARFIAKETKKDPKIKWVNDIYLDNKKVCGILTEAVYDLEAGIVQAIIVGVGINLTTAEFPPSLCHIAASTGYICRNKAAAEIFEAVRDLCYRLPRRDFMQEYKERSLVIGKTVRFFRNGVEYTALAEDITPKGELLVKTDNGEALLLNSGEISVKLF